MTISAPSRAEPIPLLDLKSAHDELRASLDHAWRRILERDSYIGGPAVQRFEHEWAQFCGVNEAVGVANGTDALVLALRALGIGEGDEVIVPATTFVATVEAVVLAGATPKFVDVDDSTLLMTGDAVGAACGPRSAAVIAVHLYGQMAPMDDIVSVARRAGIAVVEDAAQAHGATLAGRRAGSFGAAGCFSFYPGKNLGALGDAGAIVTDDAALAQRVRSLADHGRSSTSKHDHRLLGTNSRLDALQAAMLSAKLPRLDDWNAARRRAMSLYLDHYASLDVRPVGAAARGQSACHLNVIRVEERDAVATALANHGVASGLHYPVPCHHHAPYRSFADGPLAVSEQAAHEVLSLPLFPHMRDAQVDRVCEVLDFALREVGA